MKMLEQRIALGVLALGALSACQPSATDGYETVETFADGYGVVRSSGEIDGMELSSVAIGPEAASFDGKSIDDTPPINLDQNSVTVTGSDANGVYYSATGSAGSDNLSITYYLTNNGDATVLYGVSSSGDSALSTGGTLASDIPISGTSTFRGAMAVGDRRTGAFAETGTFTMSVNFGTDTAAIQGNTTNSSLSGTGISLNSRGEMDGGDLTLEVNGVTYDATLYGNVHGAGATSVSGVFHDIASNPEYGGAFAGQ